MPPCLTLSIIRYILRIKWSNPGKGVAPSPTSSWSSYWKGSLQIILDYGCQLYLYIRCTYLWTANYSNLYFWLQFQCCRIGLWRQHPTKQQLYSHLPPITKTIQIRWTRHAGHYWRSRDELISDVLLWTPIHGRAKAGRPAWTYSSSVRIRGVALRTCWKRWTIVRGGERGSGISVLMVQQDDDEYPF